MQRNLKRQKSKTNIMNKESLFEQIKKKESFLCVGLDPDVQKMPKSLGGDLFAFNKKIIDATAKYAVAYKPNAAFYEARGLKGMEYLHKTVEYIKEKHPEMFVILDAKRGDIGNTSRMYAEAAFDDLGVDAVTVAPYMGEDSVTPFLNHDGKWVVLLALTSNKGSGDFQLCQLEDGQKLFEKVLETSKKWADSSKMMYVVGATNADKLTEVRTIVPDSFLLIPGVGAQGGSLSAVAEYGMNGHCGLLVNSSRGIIHASSDDDFDSVAAEKAKELQEQMSALLKAAGLI